MDKQTKVTGVILAGGRARRMEGNDKGLVKFQNQPLVSYAIHAMQPVVDELVINANRNITEYQQFGLPVISDQTGAFDGPLAGILAAMLYAKTGVLLVMPCDSPFIKPPHLQKLLTIKAETDVEIVVAYDGQRCHPVFLAMEVNLATDLAAYLATGERKVETWLNLHHCIKVDFSDEPGLFANINSLAELNSLAQDH